MSDVLARGLPKWPQMLVSGTPIEPEQALEIIRRTDSFFYCPSGNDDEFVDYWSWRYGLPSAPRHNLPEAERWAAWDRFEAETKAWLAAWGALEHPYYVRNDWVSSCFVCGPNGWCWPDGTISHCYNVGKWPAGEEVRDDWKVIAEHFPFLNLGIVLNSAEHCEENLEPVIGFLVQGGEVKVVDPREVNPLKGFPPPRQEAEMDEMTFDLSREHGIDEEILERWATERDKREDS